MAVAIPVLEREITEEKEVSYNFTSRMTADELHNSKIRENYARLMNPELKLGDLIAEKPANANMQRSEAQSAPAVEPYLVENARADSDLFRADSPINRRIDVKEATLFAEQETEEEDNEDLRPTLTTIQYKTSDAKVTVEEGKIRNAAAEKRSVLGKREKIIIGVVIAVIVSLFALIIINSAIISNINQDLNSLQSSLISVKAGYATASDNVNYFWQNEQQIITEWVKNIAG